MANEKTSIIMAGDDKQLGVTIQSESGKSVRYIDIFSQTP
jgi:hypothetical protein